MPLHVIKLCVGCDTVEELLTWRATSFHADEPWTLRTRHTPRRAAEIIGEGSLYRVYKGAILSRQRILEINTVIEGGRKHCEMILDTAVVRTVPTPRRPFQGWRYLPQSDAPADLSGIGGLDALPIDLAERLRALGAW